MSYSPSSSFQSAATYLSSASSLSNVSPNTKLELYGLYKYLTTSHTPSSGRPSIFDMTGRAKWDAWTKAGEAWGSGREPEAELRYLKIARELGWMEGAPIAEGKESSGQGEEESIWDEDSPITGTSRRTGGVGLGNTVSILSALPLGAEDMDTLHGFAVSGNLAGLNSFLQKHPEADINAFDAHGYTSLHLAADRGHVALVRRLLELGADVNLKDADEFTAVELARVAEHVDIEALLERKI